MLKLPNYNKFKSQYNLEKLWQNCSWRIQKRRTLITMNLFGAVLATRFK